MTKSKNKHMKPFSHIFLIFSFLLSLSYNPCLNAQNFSISGDINVNEFNFRVKQFSEFVDRFNFETDHKGEPINEDGSSGLTRKLLLATLFNQDDARFMAENDASSAEYMNLVKNFINEVCENELYLNKHSENIYARSVCSGKYHKKDIDFSIILQQERVGRDMLKWVVRDMEADFLEFLEVDTIMLKFLPPSSDKLDFMELRRAFSDSTHLDGYSYRDYKYDPLSVFYYLLYTGEVKLESILEIEYIIKDIPGYEMVLRDFNRHSNNSGWLIRDLKEAK